MKKQEVTAATLEQLLHTLATSEQGLSAAEAKSRFAKYGRNVLPKKSVSLVTVFARQFQNTLVYLLVIATFISYAIKDYTDGTVILVILLLNTLLGFFQEYKSEKIIQKLSSFITSVVRVKREGKMLLVPHTEVVVGDVLILREGDIAPADMRLFEADNLQVDESQLTGESLPVTKKVVTGALENDESLIFTGSTIQKGEAIGIVYATGMETAFGEIAALSTMTKKETAYEKSLKSFSSVLIKIVVSALVIVFIAKLLLVRGQVPVTALLLFVISMAVAVVPEVLPVIATVSLSSGALKLAKRHVVVKRLSSVEDLGNITVLCTDKTGTITENTMVIQHIVSSNDELFQVFGYATIAVLKNRKHRVESSYDDAFINYVNPDIKTKAADYCIIKELPFDPDDKRRRVVLRNLKTNQYYLVVIGAPDILLGIAASDHKAEYLQTIAREGATGLHHISLAYKQILYTEDYDIIANEHDLEFLGYVSLSDPLRKSAKATIEQAEKLGIQIKILTGDSKEVAGYIGREVGLMNDASVVYLGDELDAMTPEAFKKAVIENHVFARVSPTQKYNIIKVLKECCVVGYQGDGINDAPALKLADVAIAVNSATDIAKENADIVLLNKDLEVIINGIKYGRTIFVNINKYITYSMVNNFGTFIALAVLYLFSKELPLLPIQILFTNVLTDIPLVTIYSDTVEDQEVIAPEHQQARQLLKVSLLFGIPTALFELLYFVLIRHQSLITVQTSLYLYFTFIALIVFYALRTKTFFWRAKRASLLLNSAFLLAFMLSLGVIYVPLLQHYFHFTGLSLAALGTVIATMAIYFVIIDVFKVWYYRTY